MFIKNKPRKLKFFNFNFKKKINLLKSGDFVRVFILFSKIPPQKGYLRFQNSITTRRKRGSIRRRGFKYWRIVSFFGRIVYIFLSKQNVKYSYMSLQFRKRKELVRGLFFFSAPNLFSIFKFKKQYRVRRKNLNFLRRRFQIKFKRLFPIRRHGRKKKKVK